MHRRTAVAAVIVFSALLPVTGCARNAEQTVVTAPNRSVPGAVPDEKNCPTAAEWWGSPAPAKVGSTPVNDPAAEALSQAVGAQGRDAFADVYGSQVTDYPPGRVALCVTDLARGRQLAAAAKQAHPGIDLSRLDLYRSRYAQRTLDAALDKINAAARQGRLLGFPLFSSSPVTDASGIEVTSTAQGTASQALHDRLAALAGGIPVTVVKGAPATAK